MNKEETPQKAWYKKANAYESNLSTTKSVMTDAYLTGIDDFKASLREEIENLLKITENELEDNTIEKQAWMEALEKTLQLLDTVKPSTS